MATPEWFSRLKRRTAEIIDFENDALERDMVRSQETPSEAQETGGASPAACAWSANGRRKREIAARLREWNSRNVSKVSRGVLRAVRAHLRDDDRAADVHGDEPAQLRQPGSPDQQRGFRPLASKRACRRPAR